MDQLNQRETHVIAHDPEQTLQVRDNGRDAVENGRANQRSCLVLL